MKLAMIGLGKMGANMALRLAGDAHQIVAYDLQAQTVDALAAQLTVDRVVVLDAVADLGLDLGFGQEFVELGADRLRDPSPHLDLLFDLVERDCLVVLHIGHRVNGFVDLLLHLGRLERTKQLHTLGSELGNAHRVLLHRLLGLVGLHRCVLVLLLER